LNTATTPTPTARHLSTARFIPYAAAGWPSEASASMSAIAAVSRTFLKVGRMFSRPLRNSWS